jgi:predicted RND superfamily exporter protein
MQEQRHKPVAEHASEARFGVWVIERRWLIIVASILLVAVAASGLGRNSFTSNYRIYFGPENPELLAFQELENTFIKNDNIMIVLAPKNKDVFRPEVLGAIQFATERAWQLPYSNRVDSLTNFQYTSADGDDFLVRDLVPATLPLDRPALATVRRIALAEPTLVDRLVSQDGAVTAVNIMLQIDRDDKNGNTPAAAAAAQALVDEIKGRYPNIDIYLTGRVMLDFTFEDMSKQDIEKLVPLSLGLMLALLLILLRSVSATFVVLLIIAFSIVVAMCLFGYSGVPLSSASAAAPTIILTVAIANAVHLVLTVLSGMGHGLAKRAAIVESMRINLQPVCIASATTVLGFLSMNFSDVPPFAHMGNAVSIGVLTSLLLTITFLPACLYVLPVRPNVPAVSTGSLNRFAKFVVRRRRALLIGTSTLSLLLISGLPMNEFNDVFVHYFDKGTPFRDASDFTVENLTGISGIDFGVYGKESGAASDPGFMGDVARLSDWLRTQPEILHVSTYTDVIKRLNRNLHGDDPDFNRLPESREMAAQYLLLYEMSLPYGLDLNDQLNVDKSSTRLSVRTRTLSSRQTLELEQRVSEWVNENTEHIDRIVGTGTAVMFSHIAQRTAMAMVFGISFALALISLLLIFALRSLKIGLISLIPNLIPAALGFGLWGFLVGEIGLGLSVVSGMTLGIVVDDTVHFLSKYLRARREKDFPPDRAVVYAFTTVGRAMIISSVVLIVGFLVLATSEFSLNSSMGTLTAIVIGFALAADFLLLPPLLMKIEENRDVHSNCDRVARSAA